MFFNLFIYQVKFLKEDEIKVEHVDENAKIRTSQKNKFWKKIKIVEIVCDVYNSNCLQLESNINDFMLYAIPLNLLVLGEPFCAAFRWQLNMFEAFSQAQSLFFFPVFVPKDFFCLQSF